MDAESVHRQLAAWQARVAADWGLHLPHPELRWDLRGRAAGQCRGSHLIRLNPGLHALPEADRLDTLAHEYAHAVVHALLQHGPLPPIPRGRRRDWLRPHGLLWQAVMRSLGHVPSRTHGFDLAPARQSRRHPYRCGCGEHQLGPVRHRRVQRGEAEYRCRRCAEPLRYRGSEGEGA